jgi:fatty acid desaturase
MAFEPTSSLPAREPTYRERGRYGRSNLLIAGLQVVAWASLLTAIDRSGAWWVTVPLVLLFCAVMQGVFSMMHEFFHGQAHADWRLNYGIGLVLAAIFGSSATVHRVNHWGHHVRNRTSAERGEFVHDGENPVLKTLLYYTATCGGLWVAGVVLPVVMLFVPHRAIARLAASKRTNTYAAAFEQFTRADWSRVRIEALILLGGWAFVLGSGVWRPTTVLVAYGALAYHWSTLQWIYHLRTPIDVVEGAYNLRIPEPVRWLWLSFNFNLTHHRRPDLPWQELGDHTDRAQTQPLWWRWLLQWLPPVRFPDDTKHLEKTYF